jgi:magnesium transporter
MAKSKRKFLPGSLVYTGDTPKETSIRHVKYNDSSIIENDIVQELQDDVVDWIVVEGLSDVDRVKELCLSFRVDHLIIEDILNVHQRTKFEIFDDYVFIVVRYATNRNDQIQYDYMSLLLFHDCVITFTELEHPFVNDVLERLQNDESIIKTKRHDYLLYVLLDMIVDESIEVYSDIHKTLMDIEQDILSLDSSDQLLLYNIRKHLVFIRNLTVELEEHLTDELLDNHYFFEEHNMKYYDDVIDHVLNLHNRVVNDIESIKHILDVYINTMSNKMNQIMKTLTIFSAIFIPLSFIAGIFGMNFTNFPVLQQSWGMMFFLALCFIIPGIMIVYFYKKGWFK